MTSPGGAHTVVSGHASGLSVNGTLVAFPVSIPIIMALVPLFVRSARARRGPDVTDLAGRPAGQRLTNGAHSMPLPRRPLSFHRPNTHSGNPALAKKPNYDFEKRKKEQDRQKKKELKREERLQRKRADDDAPAPPTSENEPE